MNGQYDVIVVGVGTMGAATCAYLAHKGVHVLGLEQHTIPNDLASHSGYTRIIRKAYYEHPDYVPLLQRSYELWQQLQWKVGTTLYHETGILYLGHQTSPVLQGCLDSSHLYNIPVEQWSRAKTKDRFPQFHYPEQNWISLWEPEAGYLDVHESITSFYKTALDDGAEIHEHEHIMEWHQHDDTITIQTDKSTYLTKKVIFTTGAWTQKILPSLISSLKVTRQTLAWQEMPDNAKYTHPHFPCWFLHDPEKGMYYGFPDADIKDKNEPFGIKIALHVQGDEVSPGQMDRSVHIEDEAIIQHFNEQYLPEAIHAPKNYKTCMYTNTPDEHFIIDYLPQSNSQVIIACGFSGHGFKFAPVIGEVLGQMAMGEKLTLDINFLRLNRFKL